MNRHLTPASYRMLIAMHGDPEHEAFSGDRHVWVGTRRFAHLTLQNLLRLCLVSQDQFSEYRWSLNAEGRKIIEDNTYQPEILKVMAEAKR